MNEIDVEGRLTALRARVGSVDFAAGFADRVMARLAAAETLPVVLQRLFFRFVPLAAAAALVLAAINLRQSRTGGQNLLERVLGLPAVTLANAYAFEGGR